VSGDRTAGDGQAPEPPASDSTSSSDDARFARPAGLEGPFEENPARPAARPFAAPRPSAGQQAAFGRPASVAGGFAGDRPLPPARPVPPPPPEALLRAFGPPTGQAGLQEPPGGRPGRRRTATGPWWKPDARSDPWRDPYAPAGLGAPAVYDEDAQPGPVVVDAGGRKKVRLRDLSIRLSTLVLLAVLLVGAVGGGIGFYLTRTADESPLLAPGTQLSEVDPGVTREPGSVAQIAERVTPAVVSIEVRVGQAGATGSGVVIEGENGYIVTNNHVVSGADGVEGAEIRAVFSDGSGSAARIVGRDPASDIAVLKVEKPGLVTASLGSSDDVVVGDPVVAIGSPLGLAGTVTSGIISALDRPVRLAGEGTDTNAVISAVQTDAPINPGNSGGALVDASGALIGINTAIASTGAQGGSIGLGFAIPVDTVRDIAEQLISTGKAVHASLGVNTRSVTDGARDGALVLNVEPGSAAASAGLREQDVVIGVEGEPVGSSEELVVAVDAYAPGDTITVEVVRGGSSQELEATLDTA
jgi:S1-C subfamily serine protease